MLQVRQVGRSAVWPQWKVKECMFQHQAVRTVALFRMFARFGDSSIPVLTLKECFDNLWDTIHSTPSVPEHLDGAGNKA